EGAANGRPVAFEVRDGATPAVAVSGGVVVVTATTDDVDGYAQPWDSGTRPAKSTPRQIAAYWAALLQDYVSLFGQGQRPSRTAGAPPGRRGAGRPLGGRAGAGGGGGRARLAGRDPAARDAQGAARHGAAAPRGRPRRRGHGGRRTLGGDARGHGA